MQEERNIIFFDGVCNLCNGFVDFAIRRNKKRDLYYASLQSHFAKQVLGEKGIDVSRLSTVYFLSGGVLYAKSTAVLQISKYLSAPYPALAAVLRLVHRRLRDFVYDLVAANRYKIRGRRDTCRLPTPGERQLFLS